MRRDVTAKRLAALQRSTLVGLASWLLGLSVSAQPVADWPQFRGPNRDGRSGETGLLASWPDAGLPVKWRAALGEGYSAISVVEGRLYTMAGDGTQEFAICAEADSGQQIWRTAVGRKWTDRWGNGPRSTPTVDAGVVYALGSYGDLVALRAADGQTIWSRNLPRDYGAKPPQWGVSTSPLVLGRLLVVDVGGRAGSALVAFDKTTGVEIWRSGNAGAAYSAPVALTVAGIPQILAFNATGLVGVSPADGKLLWKKDWKTSYGVNAATPIFVEPDGVFVSTGYGTGAALLRLRPDEAGFRVEEVWRSNAMKNKFSSSVLQAGHVYGFDERILKCVDVRTGETRWRKRDFGHGSLIYADGHLIVLGDQGELAWVEATPDDYRQHGWVQVLKGKTWTAPSLSDGTLYVRDQKEWLALDLTGQPVRETAANP